jgi:hypothetical protein
MVSIPVPRGGVHLSGFVVGKFLKVTQRQHLSVECVRAMGTLPRIVGLEYRDSGSGMQSLTLDREYVSSTKTSNEAVSKTKKTLTDAASVRVHGRDNQRRCRRAWLLPCREAGLQTISRGLARGLAPHQVLVCHQDLTRALTALKSKRLQREAISEDEKKPEKHAVFSEVCKPDC